jgi:hypothetical protein
MENMGAEEYKRKSREYEIRESRKGLMVHAAIVSVVSIMLAFINLTYASEFMWFVFPMAGMAIGVVMHYLFGVRLASTFIAQREKRIEEWR